MHKLDNLWVALVKEKEEEEEKKKEKKPLVTRTRQRSLNIFLIFHGTRISNNNKIGNCLLKSNQFWFYCRMKKDSTCGSTKIPHVNKKAAIFIHLQWLSADQIIKLI